MWKLADAVRYTYVYLDNVEINIGKRHNMYVKHIFQAFRCLCTYLEIRI